MATWVFCDECDKTFFSLESGYGFNVPPIGWVSLECMLAPSKPPEEEPPQFGMVAEAIGDDGHRFQVRSVAQTTPGRPITRSDLIQGGVVSLRIRLCPSCAERRISGLKFTRPGEGEPPGVEKISPGM